MEEKYQLHALCSLFPRLTGFEFECLNLGKSRLHGLHKFSQAMITAIPSKIHAGFFDVFHASVQTGDMNTTKKPISFDGLDQPNTSISYGAIPTFCQYVDTI